MLAAYDEFVAQLQAAGAETAPLQMPRSLQHVLLQRLGSSLSCRPASIAFSAAGPTTATGFSVIAPRPLACCLTCARGSSRGVPDDAEVWRSSLALGGAAEADSSHEGVEWRTARGASGTPLCGRLGGLSLDFLEVMPLGCTVALNHDHYLLMRTLIPLAILLASVMWPSSRPTIKTFILLSVLLSLLYVS